MMGSLLWAVSHTALSSPADKDQPIEIRSDAAEYFRNGRIVHKGHVRVEQGSRQLKADDLIIEKDAKGQIKALIASGAPAHFEAETDQDKPKAHGRANLVRFFPAAHRVEFVGQAELAQQDTIQGPLLIYNLEEKSLLSPQGRTLIILQTQNQGPIP